MVVSSRTSSYIATCQCKDMPDFARDAFRLLRPHDPVPEVYSNTDMITVLSNRYIDSEFQKYLKGLARSKERFAYLFDVTPDGDIISVTNLKTGARVQ